MPHEPSLDAIRLRVKIDGHEFDAEGPREVVAEHFKTWQQLITARRAGEQRTEAEPQPGVAEKAATTDTPSGRDIFALDQARGVVSLRLYPAGKSRHADAALLLLYGHRLFFGDQARVMPVRRLKAALVASGRPARVDHTLARHVAARLVSKEGWGKGNQYQLTETGYQRAIELTQALRATLTSEKR